MTFAREFEPQHWDVVEAILTAPGTHYAEKYG